MEYVMVALMVTLSVDCLVYSVVVDSAAYLAAETESLMASPMDSPMAAYLGQSRAER